jgi:hypothetical protein
MGIGSHLFRLPSAIAFGITYFSRKVTKRLAANASNLAPTLCRGLCPALYLAPRLLHECPCSVAVLSGTNAVMGLLELSCSGLLMAFVAQRLS